MKLKRVTQPCSICSNDTALMPEPARKIVQSHAQKLRKFKALEKGCPDSQVNSDEQLQVANRNLSVALTCDKAWKIQPVWTDNTLEPFYDGYTAPREVCSACFARELSIVKSTRRLRIHLIINWFKESHKSMSRLYNLTKSNSLYC